MSTVNPIRLTRSALCDATPAARRAGAPASNFRDEWVIRLPRIRIADRLHAPGRFTIDAADSDWLFLAVVMEGSGRIADPAGPRTVRTGEAVILPVGQAVAVRSSRWVRLLVVGGLISAMPLQPVRPNPACDIGPALEQIARIGRNIRSIAAILERSAGSTFDTAVEESVYVLMSEILRAAQRETIRDTA